MRNWNSYQSKVSGIGSESLLTLCDPQTSGGLLICVDGKKAKDFEQISLSLGYEMKPFGKLSSKSEFWITIK
jgi:selenide,water dikinase